MNIDNPLKPSINKEDYLLMMAQYRFSPLMKNITRLSLKHI